MNLNDKNLYKKFDTGQAARSIELLPDQIRQVLGEARLIKVPREYSEITNIVINGMGGSNLGARIIKSAWADQIKVPIAVTPGYEIPAYVDKNTLYIISSYSGTTEEPLSVYQKVKKRGAKILAITEDGAKNKLKKLMLKNDIPGYIFKPEFNPSGQPRLALGYSIFGMATLLAKTGLFSINVKQIKNIIAVMEIENQRLATTAKTTINAAKKIAQELSGKIPILIGAEFIVGNLHAMRNQINECSKNFADYLEIPDLNHYTMEGLIHPPSNKNNLMFLFFDSKYYSPRVQKRMLLTETIVNKNSIKTFKHELKGSDKLTQVFIFLQLGAWISYYLGILNQVDPIKIPWVNWFKKQLK
ncbi:MAG: SIS domain-containing protein [Patescibacteria group bacterium]|nr:SIS domain-containing protein [Patescibacteria group bacterium]